MKQIPPNTLVQSRYLVVQPIGKGGMGEVYLAVDQRLGSAVALKRTKFDSDSTLGNAFEREARILARLRHPCLPKVIDHFIDGEGQFLVMEHISGDDLDKRLSTANKPFPLQWVMFWADQLLDALNYLHSHEPPIIHRDIKPQNLKLTDDNHIVLLDFGLSKDFETGSKEAPAAGSVVGYSPHFASMELYQFLSNTVPPDALTRAEAILGGQDDPLAPLPTLNAEVTKPISDVILQGMSVRQDRRWASAADMQKVLRRAFNAPKTDTATEAKTVMMESPFATESAPAKTEPLPVVASMPTIDRIHNSAPPADVTVRMDAPAFEASRDLPGDKTEVMPPAHTTQPSVPEATPPMPLAAAASAGVVATSQAASLRQAPSQPPAQAVAAPQRKKGSSKMPFILGALVGVVILAGAAGGGGWYYYNNVYKAKAEPTPSPQVNIPPTPIPTINVVDSSRPEPVNANVPTSTPVPEKDVTASGPSTKSTPQTVAKTTDTTKPAKTPAPKATPKKDDRTTIMQ
jgi:hypothetical protein